MEWNGRLFCDWCASPLLDSDRIDSRIPKESGIVALQHFHNRRRGDCMDQKLTDLAKKAVSITALAPRQ